jgi:hypothetical protein
MSDPQDLLYTNNFISTNILSDENLRIETKYYDKFKNYIDENTITDTEQYVNNNIYETSKINIDRTLDNKWPITDKKNHYPLFDTYINDISVNRYKKEIITKVNIDSRNRDLKKFIYPNDFTLEFPKVFNNVKKFIINDIIFPNILQSISNVNNNLTWQYPSDFVLVNENIDKYIIPVPDNNRQVFYSKLPNSVYSYNTVSGSANNLDINNLLTYQTDVIPSYYTISGLILNIRRATSFITHGYNLSSESISEIVLEEPYLVYPKRIGTPHLFTTSIDPISSTVRFVNRMEEIEIIAIQTFSPYENNFKENDLFYNFSSLNSSLEYNLDTQYIYVTLLSIDDITYQYYYNTKSVYTPNPFPLVITNLLTDVGNVNNPLLNFTEFYDLNIYLQNGYTEKELDSISYYKFIDIITLESGEIDVINLNKKYLRFALKLSTGIINGHDYNVNGKTIRPSITSNTVFSNSLNSYLNNYRNVISPKKLIGTSYISSTTEDPGSFEGTFVNIRNTSGILCEYTFSFNKVLIGRALLFRWIFDKKDNEYIQYEYNTDNEKKRSILGNLAWPIANSTNYLYTIDKNNGFRFVHANFQPVIINKFDSTINQKINYRPYPLLSLNLQKFTDDYYFINNSYVFLKIDFNTNYNNESNDEIVNAISSNDLQYNQNYIDSKLFNVPIGGDYTCLENNNNIIVYKKDQNHIFAKLILSNTPGNTNSTLSNIINNNNFSINYNNILDNISSINISVYDANLKLISLTNDFSFTLNIYEIKDVLKETLINSKTNNVTSTGNFI